MKTPLEKVEDAIRLAFQGVRLDDGLGLREANCLDDCSSVKVQAACREQDEKEDWSRIDSDDLEDNDVAFSFFDEKGMRFHLPAFLIADLKSVHDQGYIASRLSRADSRFQLLNQEQRAAVRGFLTYLLSRAERPYMVDQINDALNNEFWQPVP